MPLKKIHALALLCVAAWTSPVHAQSRDLARCNATTHAGFVGKPMAELQALRKDKVRFVCQGCPMTMDFRQDRLTVIFDRASRRILRMDCS